MPFQLVAQRKTNRLIGAKVVSPDPGVEGQLIDSIGKFRIMRETPTVRTTTVGKFQATSELCAP